MDLELDQKIYRVYVEESFKAEHESSLKASKWRYLELRGEYGIVHPFSKDHLLVYFNSNRKARQYRHRLNWMALNAGSFESTFLIPNADWKMAAEAINAKKKKVYTPLSLEKMRQWGKQLSQRTHKS